MAERRLRYPLLWILFIAVMVIGAALVLNDNGGLQALGVAIFVLPLVGFGILALVYYLLERFRARRGETK